MSELSEKQRVEQLTNSEPSPPVEVRLHAQTHDDPVRSLSRVREVMAIVAEQHDAGAWPDDEWWKIRLPNWFVGPFEGRTINEVMKDPTLWDFGSWLDVMKSPGWQWWSSGTAPDGWVLRLRALSDPYSIEPLEYLARASGGTSLAVEEGP